MIQSRGTRIRIHGHDDFTADLTAVEHVGYFRAGDGFQANEAIDLSDGLLIHQFLRVIEGDTWIALDVDHIHDFDIVALKTVIVAAQPMLSGSLAPAW